MIAKALRAGVIALDMEAKGTAAMIVVDGDDEIQDVTLEWRS